MNIKSDKILNKICFFGYLYCEIKINVLHLHIAETAPRNQNQKNLRELPISALNVYKKFALNKKFEKVHH